MTREKYEILSIVTSFQSVEILSWQSQKKLDLIFFAIFFFFQQVAVTSLRQLNRV
jgi:hypothetical protein